MNNMELVEIKNLSKSYDDKEVLKEVNLKISCGKIIGLLGKNGAGKTTLIKLINDLLTPTNGEIKIKGNSVGVESKKNYCISSRKNILKQTNESIRSNRIF